MIMSKESIKLPDRFTISQLSELTGFSVRSIRYYVQEGLLDKPDGIKRNAYYRRSHLEQLIQIKKGQEAGYSLRRIEQMIRHPEIFKPAEENEPGTVSVKSHIQLAPGVELVVSPEHSGLSSENLKYLIAELMKSIKNLKEENNE